MDRYVVVGNPISHSLSPAIHAMFARETGESVAYSALLVEPGDFARALRAFFSGGGRGANVTLPFKIEASELADERSDRAALAGAANFLAVRDGRLHADNTDGAGLVADLGNAGFELRGQRVALLGAGGAARGVVGPLLDAGAAEVVVANRTRTRALELASRFAALGRVRGAGLDEVAGERFDLVLNATSGSTRGETLAIPAGLLTPATLAYDMAYGASAKGFLDAARARGARARDGLGMLVEQAAESFVLWRGVRPRTAPVIAELRGRGA